MKKILKIIFAVLLLCLFLRGHQGKAEAANYNQQEMKKFVEQTMDQNKVRGSILVIKNGQTQEIKYGWAFRGKGIGNGNSRTIYPSGSLQKVVTGAIIQQLIDEKKISAQSKLSRWYPRIKNSTHITVANLLTHTSGINVTGTEIRRNKVYSENDAIQWVLNQAYQRSYNNPGSFSYNNTNFILLAGIISKVTHKSFAENFEERIVKPLNLKNTFLSSNVPNNKVKAISYVWGTSRYSNAVNCPITLTSQIPGAGNMYTTPMDYYKIQLGLTNGKILTQREFNSLTNLNHRPNNYSGGVYIKNNGKLKMAYGAFDGAHYGNWFQMTSDNKNGIIMFLNVTHGREADNKAVAYTILNNIKANTFVEN